MPYDLIPYLTNAGVFLLFLYAVSDAELYVIQIIGYRVLVRPAKHAHICCNAATRGSCEAASKVHRLIT